MSYLNIRKFLNLSVRLAFEAAKVIHELKSTVRHNKTMKGFDDPVTEVPLISIRQTSAYRK